MSSTSPVQESPQKSQFTSDQRWQDVALDFRLMQTREEAEEGKNSPRARWKRAVFLASRLQDGTRDPTGQTQMSPPDEETPPASSERKQLELQHWLELIDGKHRYGSNLKYYHRRWQEDDSTKQNFFYWLDRGEGRELSLEDCPRDKLENQLSFRRTTFATSSFLSYSSRLITPKGLNYLVTIDNDGKLRWKRNDQLLDTTPGKWKDTKDHSGIIPKDHPLHNKGQSFAKGKSREGPGVHRFLRTWTTLYNRLIKKEVWIYVADKNNNVYIGIKDTGTFQHSSFLAGGLVTSAGIISVKKGVIHTLRPLSGHYRTTQKHFHSFIIALKEKGADLEKADILEGKLALWGTQKLGKAQKAPKQAKESIKSEIQDSSTKIAEKVSKVEDSSWKRDVLYGRKNLQSKENSHTIS